MKRKKDSSKDTCTNSHFHFQSLVESFCLSCNKITLPVKLVLCPTALEELPHFCAFHHCTNMLRQQAHLHLANSCWPFNQWRRARAAKQAHECMDAICSCVHTRVDERAHEPGSSLVEPWPAGIMKCVRGITTAEALPLSVSYSQWKSTCEAYGTPHILKKTRHWKMEQQSFEQRAEKGTQSQGCWCWLSA